MRRIKRFAAAAVFVFAGSAWAQNTFSNADRAYLIKDAQGSVYDNAVARVGMQKASRSKVYDYAVMVNDDHARLTKTLLELARKKNVVVPVEMERSDAPRLRRLLRANGSAFDRAYLEESVRINSEDVSAAGKELSLTKDEDVRNAVNDFLKTEQKHLDDARVLLGQTTK